MNKIIGWTVTIIGAVLLGLGFEFLRATPTIVVNPSGGPSILHWLMILLGAGTIVVGLYVAYRWRGWD